jgi:hypothetical protein
VPPPPQQDACPPTTAERRRFYSRTTTEALKETRQHQHKGAHPYRVVLGEVRGGGTAAWRHAGRGMGRSNNT